MNVLRSIRDMFGRRPDLVERFTRAMAWIAAHTGAGAGIAVSSGNPSPYPEVTGYFTPTLKRWGERETAMQYARWLASIQNPDGSWSDPTGTTPYTFDTGQILKGLLACVDLMPELEPVIRRGCDWIVRQIGSDGRVTTPNTADWGLPGGRTVPEAIHLYALEPLRVAGARWKIPEYEESVQRALDYYLADPALTDFTTLSHFHAYIVEALVDLGHPSEAARAMEKIAALQREDGSVPAYAEESWVCSTGLFQYAVIWYRLGERSRAERAFSSACSLQNRSGGFFGGYGEGVNYFVGEEIAWAIKYFLDALWWKIRTGFDEESAIFPEAIDEMDGRYRLVAETVRATGAGRILEAGCGKGRLLRRLNVDFPSSQLTGLDLSPAMLEALPASIAPLQGSLLDIPAADGAFDLVFCVETLEHAVNIGGALRELCRVLAPGGTLIVIDKNRTCIGSLQLAEWEQWFRAEKVAVRLRRLGCSVRVERRIPYDGRDGRDGLFLGWVAHKGGTESGEGG